MLVGSYMRFESVGRRAGGCGVQCRGSCFTRATCRPLVGARTWIVLQVYRTGVLQGIVPQASMRHSAIFKGLRGPPTGFKAHLAVQKPLPRGGGATPAPPPPGLWLTPRGKSITLWMAMYNNTPTYSFVCCLQKECVHKELFTWCGMSCAAPPLDIRGVFK